MTLMDLRATEAGSLAAKALTIKLSAWGALDDDDRRLLSDTVPRSRDAPSGVRLPGLRLEQQYMIVSGWVARQRFLADGRRQIVSTIVPGETVGAYPNPWVSMATVALTDVRLADLSELHEALARNPGRHAAVRRGLTLASRLEEAQLAEHVVRLGRRTAFERVGHWILDVHQRLGGGRAQAGDRFAMPLTQETLGDTLGLSLVHVNRIVQQLRREELAEIKGGYVKLLAPDRLRLVTEYEPLSASPSNDA